MSSERRGPPPSPPWERWDGAWQPLNLASPTYAVPPTPPASELLGLFYRGKRHVVSGPSESMKTIVVWLTFLEGMRRAGLRVGCIDFEMGPTATRRLLVDLGATDDELRQITYLEPDAPPAADDIDAIAQSCDAVLIDAAAGAYSASGLDDNARKDAETFARTWITPLWQRSVATITVDHVVKNASNRDRYAIGSERKLGQADVHLGIEAVTTLTRGGNGLVKISVHKDRPGFLTRPHAAEIHLASDADSHQITWTVQAPAATCDEWRPTRLMEKVSRLIELTPSKRTDIYATLKGNHDYLIFAVNSLIADGYASPSVPGEKGTTILSIKPFREDASPPSPPSPSLPLSSVPSVPPPTGGDGDGDGHEWGDEIARLEALAEEMTAAGAAGELT